MLLINNHLSSLVSCSFHLISLRYLMSHLPCASTHCHLLTCHLILRLVHYDLEFKCLQVLQAALVRQHQSVVGLLKIELIGNEIQVSQGD